jgi:hypothetical protein
MSSTVNTTFTFSSTDISSDALSFSVSETLSLTGSGGITRFNLRTDKYPQGERRHNGDASPDGYGTGSGYKLYHGSGSGASQNISSKAWLYIKNVTGSGFSASAAATSTASVVHLFTTASGQIVDDTGAATVEHNSCYDIARIPQGSFAYLPINPRVSYVCYTPTGSGTNESMNTIIEYGIFR